MNIGSGAGYPAGNLSNFTPHPFVIDDVECASMEGFLQSLKFKDPEMQKHVCKLTGRIAKKRGANKKWYKTQTLYWQGVEYKRDSNEYRELLDRAYHALSLNTTFAKALLASGDAVLKHSMGRTKENCTVLTVSEFCGRLTRIRTKLKNSHLMEL